MKIFKKIKNRIFRDEEIEMNEFNPTSSSDSLTYSFDYESQSPFRGKVDLFDARDNKKLLRQLPFENVKTIPFQTQLSKHNR